MLNKKGFTISEVIISFTMLTIILASVMTTAIFYRNKVKDEEVITKLVDFKNTITKVIYDDILSKDTRKIVSVERCIGTANCVNFTDVENNFHTLKIIEIPEATDNNVRGVYLSYDNTKYMLPDSDLGVASERACDFVNGFIVNDYEEDNIHLYTVKTSFKHKDFDQQYDIIFTVISNNQDE